MFGCRFAAEYPSPARNGSQNAVLSYAGPSAYLVESFSFCPTFLIFWPTSWVACFVLSTTFSVACFALSAPLSIVSLMFSFVEDMNFLLLVEYPRHISPELRVMTTQEIGDRSEEHTSELQSPRHLVCR